VEARGRGELAAILARAALLSAHPTRTAEVLSVRSHRNSSRRAVACATPRRAGAGPHVLGLKTRYSSAPPCTWTTTRTPGPRVSYAETLPTRCGCKHRQQKSQHHKQNVATTPWGDLADGFSRSKPPLLRSLKRPSTLQRSL